MDRTEWRRTLRLHVCWREDGGGLLKCYLPESEGGRRIAFIEFNEDFFLDYINVVPQFKRRGIGRMMYDHLDRFAWDNHGRHLLLPAIGEGNSDEGNAFIAAIQP